MLHDPNRCVPCLSLWLWPDGAHALPPFWPGWVFVARVVHPVHPPGAGLWMCATDWSFALVFWSEQNLCNRMPSMGSTVAQSKRIIASGASKYSFTTTCDTLFHFRLP